MQQHNQKHVVKFYGTTAQCFKIWITNLLLIICTLGIYSFWAVVKIKKFFYQNTEVNHYRFDFHGTPGQYFKGFLIAIGFYLVLVITLATVPVLGFIFLVAAVASLPWLIIKSIQFHTRMTSLNHVRFNFDGQLGPAYWVFLFAPVLMILGPLFISILFFRNFAANDIISLMMITLSCVLLFIVALPALFGIIRFLQLNYIMNSLLFGQLRFKTKLEKGPIIIMEYIACIIVVPFMIIAGIVYFLALSSLTNELSYAGNSYAYMQSIMMVFIVKMIFAYLILFFGLLCAVLYITVALRNYLFKQTTLEGIKFDSTMCLMPYVWLVFSNILMCIVTLGFAVPYAKIRHARYLADNTIVIGEFAIQDSTNDGETFDNEVNPDPAIDAIISVL